jgi:hypothetical protein
VKSYIAAGAFALVALTGCGQIDASAVDQEATKLKSTVSEAAYLLQGTSRGEYPSPFVKVRAEELGQDAGDVETRLQESKVEPSARPRAARLRETAHRLASLMDQLQSAPNDSRLASRLAEQVNQARKSLAGT